MKSQLYQLLIEDEDGSFGGAEEVVDYRETRDIIPDELNVDGLNPMIFLHALLGTCDSQTIRVQGCIKQHRVILLVDSGSTLTLLTRLWLKELGARLSPSMV